MPMKLPVTERMSEAHILPIVDPSGTGDYYHKTQLISLNRKEVNKLMFLSLPKWIGQLCVKK